jgi:hypothetical protein
MAASDYVPIFFKNRLHLAGRPQMGSRPNRRSRPGAAPLLMARTLLHYEALNHGQRKATNSETV